ncbi:MAG TPA: 16S rRNA (guanine(527)-N(7))-methyltransferase RsmG [Candidatus Sulfotelmatobacter sp.]|jgi:16S rRNA (guanine527-N7)-methyltransferase
MTVARLAELLDPFLRNPLDAPGREQAVLSPAQLEHISTYIDMLLRWNARVNLTAIRGADDIVTRHFGESLFTARHLFPRNAHSPMPSNAKEHRPTTNDRVSVADVGSGAGFPGLPIKLWAPQISLTLIESNQKKAAFLREVARALTLTDVNIQNARAESLPASSHSVVTLRAVERFESILPIAAQLVCPSGRLALLIGATQRRPAQSIVPGVIWSEPVPIPRSNSRILLVGNLP